MDKLCLGRHSRLCWTGGRGRGRGRAGKAAAASSSSSSSTQDHGYFSKGGSWVSHRRCSGTPCRSWRTRCPGPGGRCWGSAGSEPPTEAPAPRPGQLCHQVFLYFSPSMGASAVQEWGGGPLCSFIRRALAKVSERPVGPPEKQHQTMMKISVPFPAPLPLSHYRRVGEEGGRGEQPSRYGRRHHILIWTKSEQYHLSRTRSYHEDRTAHQPAEWTF